MKNRKWLIAFIGAALLGLTGCSGNQSAPAAQQAPMVRVFTAIQKDTPIVYEFVGDIQPLNEARVSPKVSGVIIEKYVNGGEYVVAGQPLFQIDSRDYQTTVTATYSQVVDSEVTHSRMKQDRVRYEQLLAQGAISQQQYDIALASENQSAAQVDARRATLTQAELNLDYTIVRAPMNGKVGVDLASVGTFAVAGQTPVATVSSLDPVQVQFSLSETDYLKFARSAVGAEMYSMPIRLTLADGSEYPESGKIVEIDRGLNQQTGTLSMKAQFNNPKELLLPSMFARVYLTGGMQKNAILIPQRSVYMQLTKSFVTVVNAEGKAEVRPVTLGTKTGQLIVVESGLQPGDQVMVEGQGKIPPGTPVQMVEIQESDLKIDSQGKN